MNPCYFSRSFVIFFCFLFIFSVITSFYTSNININININRNLLFSSPLLSSLFKANNLFDPHNCPLTTNVHQIQDSELNFLLNEAKTLKLELNTRSTLYENKLRDAKKKHAISSSEILNQIQAKKESLDMHSENLLKSFSEGNIDMSTFIQVR